MKNLLVIACLLTLAACSSKNKEEQSSQEAAVVAEPMAQSNEEAPKAKGGVESLAMDSGANMEGGFPDVEGTERSGATCKSGSDERLISVIDTKEGPCGVVYSKFGTKRTVAYAKHDMPFCDKVYSNIVSNLNSAGFDCGGAAASAAPAQEEAAPAQETAPEQAQ